MGRLKLPRCGANAICNDRKINVNQIVTNYKVKPVFQQRLIRWLPQERPYNKATLTADNASQPVTEYS